MTVLRALLGLAFFCAVSWALSSHRRRFPTRVVVFGIALQVALGAFLLRTELGVALFQSIADFVQKLISMTADGTQLIFGELANPEPGEGGLGYAFAFASNGLPVIIFFGALMAVLYHLGVMQLLIYAMARVMTAIMGVSGAEAMSMASNVFVGQTEAPLIVKPYIARMTPSELNALMTGGFATIAGSVLAVYIGFLGPEFAGHLLAASFMSAPAAFVMAKIMVPETEKPMTGSDLSPKTERTASNVLEATAIGTSDGMKLYLNVLAMLIAFVAIIAVLNWFLGIARPILAILMFDVVGDRRFRGE